MKKIINNPDKVVEDMLTGIVQAAPDKLKQIKNTNIIVKKESHKEKKVAILSGGGSGHEPAHTGFIGKGMLDAAVIGEVFTSPPVDQIYEAIKAIDRGEGVFLVIKNYTGDVLNFEMAAELATAEGYQVEQIIVNDDISVEDSSFTSGRRGIAGTVFIHKLVGAKAELGGSLQEIKQIANKAMHHIRSMGMAITPCSIPAAGEPSFSLSNDEMEIGIGIHGEPGITRKKLTTAKDIAKELTDRILMDMKLVRGDEVALMINGLGSTPAMELYIMNKEVQENLIKQGIQIYRTFVGEYMTSLEMGGCSISLLKLDEELKSLLDYPSDALHFMIN